MIRGSLCSLEVLETAFVHLAYRLCVDIFVARHSGTNHFVAAFVSAKAFGLWNLMQR